MYQDVFFSALKGLWRTKSQTVLGVFSIMIATASMVVLLNTFSMLRQQALSIFDNFGESFIALHQLVDLKLQEKPRDYYNTVLENILSLQHFLKKNIHTQNSTIYAMHYSQIALAGKRRHVTVLGIQANFFSLLHIKMNEKASVFQEREGGHTCFIGQTLAKKLRYVRLQPLIGEWLQIKQHYCQITVVLPFMPKNAVFAYDLNATVFIPLSIFRQQFSPLVSDFSFLLVQKRGEQIEKTRLFLINFCHTLFPSLSFHEADTATIEKSLREEKKGFSRAFLGVILLAFLMAGVAVLNFTGLSIAKRNQEIALRKSLGAAKRDIILLFSIEILVMMLLASVLGDLLGLMSSILQAYYQHYVFVWHFYPLFFSVVLSIIIGFLTSFIPIVRASSVPIIKRLQAY